MTMTAVAPHPSPPHGALHGPTMIRLDSVTKRYGATQAVADVSFDVAGGSVVGFLGRNGAGKSTSLRILAGLTRATEGTATIAGRPYRSHRLPMQVAGFGLDAESFHPTLSGRRALQLLAVRASVGRDRVHAVLELVELTSAADRPVGGYSLGMRQRLLLAAAMLGDPQVIVLDEPSNGLDPQGHRWLRDFLRARAGEGRAVLLSSHVLSDVAQTVDRAVVISAGTIVADASMDELQRRGSRVRVSTPDRADLHAALESLGAVVELDSDNPEMLHASATTRRGIGAVAHAHHILLHELAEEPNPLEAAFFALTEADGMELR